MIPEIGILIAGYIIARMFEMATRKWDGRPKVASILVVLLSIAAIAGAVLISADLLMRSSQPQPKIPGLGY